MKVRVGAGFIHRGIAVEPGQVLDMDEKEARQKIEASLVSEVKDSDPPNPNVRDNSRSSTPSPLSAVPAAEIRSRDPGAPRPAGAPNPPTKPASEGGKP